MAPHQILADRYELGALVGRSGMGSVYTAQDLVLGRQVAVKVLAVAQVPDEAAQRFRREAHILASLSHPHIVTVFDFGADDATGQVVVLDVRPRHEYVSGHIPGEVSVPVEELGQHLVELPADVQVVAYCRGAYCVLAYDAVRLRTRADRLLRHLHGRPRHNRCHARAGCRPVHDGRAHRVDPGRRGGTGVLMATLNRAPDVTIDPPARRWPWRNVSFEQNGMRR